MRQVQSSVVVVLQPFTTSFSASSTGVQQAVKLHCGAENHCRRTSKSHTRRRLLSQRCLQLVVHARLLLLRSHVSCKVNMRAEERGQFWKHPARPKGPSAVHHEHKVCKEASHWKTVLMGPLETLTATRSRECERLSAVWSQTSERYP